VLGLGPRKSKLLNLVFELVDDDVPAEEAVQRLALAAGPHRKWLLDVAEFVEDRRLLSPVPEKRTVLGPPNLRDEWMSRLLIAAATGNPVEPFTDDEQRDLEDELRLERIEPDAAFAWLADRVPELYDVRNRVAHMESPGLDRRKELDQMKEISDAINPLVGGHSNNPDRVISSPTAYHLCMRYLGDVAPRSPSA